MLWVCFVFIQGNMRAGVAVEPWETCFLIWCNCFCGFNAGLYLASEASKMHEILQRPSEHLNARICQIEHDFVNLWQRYWRNTTSCRVNTETMCVCDFTSKIECHGSFKCAYILLKHLNVTLGLILLLDSSHIVSQWLWFIWSHNKQSYECMLLQFAPKNTTVYGKLHTSCPHIPSKFDVNWTRSGHGAKDLQMQSSKYHCFDCFSRVRK